MALSDLERKYSTNQPPPDTRESQTDSNTALPDYFGWQVTRRFQERQGFDSAPKVDIFGRGQPLPREVQDVFKGINPIPQEEIVFKRRERRKDEVIEPETNFDCSTTKRQKRRVDQRQYKNRPPQRFNGRR